MSEKIYVYNTLTGEKTPEPVPEHFLGIFKNLSKTPTQKARESRTPATKTAANSGESKE